MFNVFAVDFQTTHTHNEISLSPDQYNTLMLLRSTVYCLHQSLLRFHSPPPSMWARNENVIIRIECVADLFSIWYSAGNVGPLKQSSVILLSLCGHVRPNTCSGAKNRTVPLPKENTIVECSRFQCSNLFPHRCYSYVGCVKVHRNRIERSTC